MDIAGGYILGFDQSTSGTKAMLFDAEGGAVGRADRAHAQKVSAQGWVSHDPDEIYGNLLAAAREVLETAGIPAGRVAGVGISNQRETALVWDRKTGRPLCDAVVWQCARAEGICAELSEYSGMIKGRTGLPLSPYFPAAKIAWVLRNAGGSPAGAELCAGTMDSWLIYRLTSPGASGGMGGSFLTDWSNASRTQLLNLRELRWDSDICSLFGIRASWLPDIADSDADFGGTDLGGLLPAAVPFRGVFGDSHAALFGQGCHSKGMAKVTYGTGSSVMVNTGRSPIFRDRIATSLAWGIGGEPCYVLEGNINYTGAVIKWLVDEVGLLRSSREAGTVAAMANPADGAYLVPAFSGLGAPHWDSGARAILCNMARSTGRAEIVRAAEQCIAYQIADVVGAMRGEPDIFLSELRVDGSPTRDAYLMQFQSDLLDLPLSVPQSEELSCIGAAYAAGLALGLYGRHVFERIQRTEYLPRMGADERARLYAGWQAAVRMARSG
ncbi:MAG: glycerol kinase [Clostridiales bacterium]|nr:glycerol kinase [Clostridiales bacterium]